MTQERLAAVLETERSTVYRWESGASTPPARQQPRIARALGISAAELVDLLAPGSNEDESSVRDRHTAHAHNRPSGTDATTVAGLRERVCDLDERYDRLPPASLLTETGQALGQIDFLARDGTGGNPRHELRAVEATAATLMGQLVWDASQRRDHRTARQYFTRATDAARAVRSPVAEGHALLRTSYVALYGESDPVEGLRLTEQAAEVTRKTSDVLTGLAQLHSAEAHAMLGGTRRCELALAAAENSLSTVRMTDEAAHLFTTSLFDRLSGSCYLFLGDYPRAQRTLGSAAETTTAPSKSRAIVLGNLSIAHLQQRDLDSAVLRLHDAIDVLETTRGGGGLNIVSDAVRKLRGWRGETVVQEVYDRVFALIAP